MLQYKPDADRAMERIEAYWHHEILDRPAIQVVASKPGGKPIPKKTHATLRDRWMDVEYQVERADASIANTYWAGEMMPSFVPNLGPEVLTASLGAELEFSEGTSWSIPMLDDWGGVPKLKVQPDNPYTRAILDMTRLACEVGKGKFLVGITDLHPGGDLAASLRDPQEFAVDLLTEPEQVSKLMDQLRPTFYDFYTLQYDIQAAAGQTITTSWLPLYTDGKYYIPSCDFSCMVSQEMFQEFMLPEIVEEVEWLDRSIYHLDGPNALQHLDALLAIEKLDAIQWVPGAGHEPMSDWMPTLQKIQKAGKAMHLSIAASELDAFIEALHPEGVMLCMGAGSVEEADALVEKVKKWRSPV